MGTEGEGRGNRIRGEAVDLAGETAKGRGPSRGWRSLPPRIQILSPRLEAPGFRKESRGFVFRRARLEAITRLESITAQQQEASRAFKAGARQRPAGAARASEPS